MVHGQGHSLYLVPVSEQTYWKLEEAFWLVEGSHFAVSNITSAMSRCFPFPPPGYDKKARFEDTDLLTKEKHKEKRRKRDKKDKEKREGSKEKKNNDKERSKEKHSDKKDRKEKHKDKKDRDKDKDKSRTSDANRIEGQPECNNEDELGPNSLQNNEISDSKYVQDLARRIRDDDRATGSQIGQKITVTDPRRGEFPGRLVECSIDNRLEEKEKANDRKDDKKVNGQRNHLEVRSQIPSVDQKRFQGIAKPVEKNGIEKVEEKEKNKLSESYDKDSKHKDRDREKKSRSKDEKRDKEKKKEKAKEVSKTSKDQIKLKDISPKLKESSPKLKHSSPNLKDSRKDFLNSSNTKISDVLKTSGNIPAVEGNLGKRKKLEINGISHDNGIRPNKLPRPVSSYHQVMENGRKLEPCHSAVPFESEWQGDVHNCIVDMKKHKINGMMEVPKPIVNSSGPLSTKATVSENGEASVKPPHPDSKYLNQILSVPKLEDCSDDLDDQEWLFSSDCARSKKSKPDSSKVDGMQVWAEALQLECADLTALPYVIPL